MCLRIFPGWVRRRIQVKVDADESICLDHADEARCCSFRIGKHFMRGVDAVLLAKPELGAHADLLQAVKARLARGGHVAGEGAVVLHSEAAV